MTKQKIFLILSFALSSFLEAATHPLERVATVKSKLQKKYFEQRAQAYLIEKLVKNQHLSNREILMQAQEEFYALLDEELLASEETSNPTSSKFFIRAQLVFACSGKEILSKARRDLMLV